VFELADQPGMLLKAYRRPVPAAGLLELVAWPEVVRAVDPALAGRVAASAAWPASVVVGDTVEGNTGVGDRAAGVDAGTDGAADGLLIPRAPRRFSVRHRDGSVHLATLSYLTAPPGQRSAAYGLALPAPMSPERLGVVYALARLLEALQAATPAVGHGDLSTKNVLWSLERGPEVFLIDCDSAERYLPDGRLVDHGPRRRAMTPNWDDPAIPPGANPTLASDRYSLALIFLRAVGAAHFPIQGRQRSGEPLSIDFEVPPPALRARSLDADAALWDLCERGLSVRDPAGRPGAAEWAAALEQVLDDLGAMALVRAVWAAQGGGQPGPTPRRPATGPERDARDVRVRPVAAETRETTWHRVTARPAPPVGGSAAWTGRGQPRPAAARPSPPTRPNPLGPGGLGPPTLSQTITTLSQAPPVPVVAPARRALRQTARAWLGMHRRAGRTLLEPGHLLLGLIEMAGCLVLDVVGAILAFFAIALLVGPLLRI